MMIKRMIKDRFYFIYWSLASICIFLLMLRIICFADKWGGIEHDSAWYLGVAKNLATQSIYASSVNTQADNKEIGMSIHGRPVVHDSDGYNYFYSSITVGPGFILPQAIFYKIFGVGWWQNRLWALTGMCLLFLLSALMISYFKNIYSLLIFFLWIWCIPQLTIVYAYEAFSEHIAVLWIILSIFFGYYSCKDKIWKKSFNHTSFLFIFFAGIFSSLAVLTKLLAFFIFLSFAIFFLIELTIDRRFKSTCVRGTFYLMGFIIPIALYNLYQYIYLSIYFTSEAYPLVLKDFQLVMQSGGSGVKSILEMLSNGPFIEAKFNFWNDVGINNCWLFWITFIFGCFYLLYKKRDKKINIIILLSLLLLSINSLWFILISPNGWFRHVWYGAYIGMLLFSIICGEFLIKSFKFIYAKKRKISIPLWPIIVALILYLFFPYQNFMYNFNFDRENTDKLDGLRHSRALQGIPPAIFSLSDQKELVSFFEKNIKKEDKIYYLSYFLAAEVPLIVDKIIFPIRSYYYHFKNGPNYYLVFDSYTHGIYRWRFTDHYYSSRMSQYYCTEDVFVNNSFRVCKLKIVSELIRMKIL
ncbi:MAG: hypothetical protein HQK49_13970 [Oligoflexia bacterium]|nr:hypothetical protein [Oligoflexia bacterium]